MLLTGDLRHGSRLFSAVSKMNFGESELHIRILVEYGAVSS